MVWVGLFIISSFLAVGFVQAKTIPLSLAATGQASSYYAYNVAIAQLVNKNVPNVNVTVLETGGFADNIKLIEREEADFAQMAEPDLYLALNSIGIYAKEKYTKARLLWLANPLVYYFVVSKEAGITDFADLQGKKYTPGGRGSSTERLCMEIFDILGVKPHYYTAGYSDAVRAMKDRRIIGYTKSGPTNAPEATIMDVSTAVPINILSFKQDQIAKIQKVKPYYKFTTVKAGLFKGVGDVTSIAIFFGSMASKDLSPDIVYQIVKVVFNNVDYIAQSYPGIKGMKLAEQTIQNASSPLHAGTIKYLKELGYKIPKNLLPPEMK